MLFKRSSPTLPVIVRFGLPVALIIGISTVLIGTKSFWWQSNADMFSILDHSHLTADEQTELKETLQRLRQRKEGTEEALTPPIKKPLKERSVIYFLTNGAGIDSLAKALPALDVAFNRQFDYPILIFHENTTEADIEGLRKSTTSRLLFREIGPWEVPDWIGEPVIVQPCHDFDIGYRHMCRFQMHLVMDELEALGFEYYLRLDSDSELTYGNITFDLFEYMDKNGYTYGYMWDLAEAAECTVGLWETTKKFCRINGLSCKLPATWSFPDGDWNGIQTYNNFEIGSVAQWKTAQCQRYLNYLDKTGGIYRHRWGDAITHGLAIWICHDWDKIVKVKGIRYNHQGNFVDEEGRVFSAYYSDWILKPWAEKKAPPPGIVFSDGALDPPAVQLERYTLQKQALAAAKNTSSDRQQR